MCDQEKLYREYLKYGVELFKYHADQRLRCIRYYTAILLACIIGVVQGARILCERNVSDELFLNIILFGLCGSAGITLFFWLLDIRNRVLTEYAEDGLKTAENCLFVDQPQKLRIVFNGEDDKYKMAWHYERILPAFFSVTIVASILVATVFLYCLFTLSLWLILQFVFIAILLLLLVFGIFAEGKFIAKKEEKIKNEDPGRKPESYPWYLKLFKRFYNYFPNGVEGSESR